MIRAACVVVALHLCCAAAVSSMGFETAIPIDRGPRSPRAPSVSETSPSAQGNQWLVTTVQIGALKDNTLYESATGLLSNGSGPSFYSGRTMQAQNARRRAVIAFDVAASVPLGSVITSVTLRLHVSQTAQGSPVSLNRLTANWGEGTSNAGAAGGGGAPATPNDATWLHRFFNTALWASQGGDFQPSQSAVATVSGPGYITWSSEQMRADVENWLIHPGSNFGWILLGNESTPGSARIFESREASTAEERPVLIVEFAGVGACCLAVGSCASETLAQCQADGGFYGGDGTSCGAAACTIGEASGSGDMRASRTGSQIAVTYVPACGATNHAVYWGTTPIEGALVWQESACDLGASGAATFDPGSVKPGASLYFVIVGQNANVEGSYGRGSSGVERPEAVGVGGCDRPQTLIACP